MDASSSPTYEDLQRRVRELEARDAAREAEKEKLVAKEKGALRLAALALEGLASQRSLYQPDGIWLQSKDLRWLKAIPGSPLGRVVKVIGTPETWVWQELPAQVTSDFWYRSYDSYRGSYRSSRDDYLEYYNVQPFRHAFPLELFLAIVALADPEDIARVARASLACFELFMPAILKRIEVRTGDRLRKIFGTPNLIAPRSSRLDSGRSFKHVRSLELDAGSLDRLPFHQTFDESRVPITEPDAEPIYERRTLQLDVLTIVIRAPIPLSREYGTVDLLPETARAFLDLVDPSKLVVAFDTGPLQERAHVISEGAADAICRWRRLREVRLKNIRLLTSLEPWDEESAAAPYLLYNILWARVSYLKEPENLTMVWDLSHHDTLPCWDHPNLLELLLHPNDPMINVKSFTVVVRTEELGKELQDLIDECAVEVPSCLKWEVKSSGRSRATQ